MWMHDQSRTRRTAVSWSVPAVAVTIGVGYLVAGWLGGMLAFGVFGLALMVGFAVFLLLAGRYSETVAGLLNRKDERISGIDTSASLFAGMVVLLTTLVMFIVEMAQGLDGSPYYQLAALGGAAYVVAVVWLRLRR